MRLIMSNYSIIVMNVQASAAYVIDPSVQQLGGNQTPTVCCFSIRGNIKNSHAFECPHLKLLEVV